MSKQRVIVVFGGRSVEHDVSVLTGLQCLEALDPTRFDGIPVYVDPDGRWWTGDPLRDRQFYPLSPRKEADLTPVRMDLAPGTRPQLLSTRKAMLGRRQHGIDFDIVIPAIHGSNGEDGTLQGLLDFAGVPYTGSPMLGSALAMNKSETKRMAAALDINVLPHAVFDRTTNDEFIDLDVAETALKSALGDTFGYPLIVKPLSLGSSIGVMKVADGDALIAGLAVALRLDRRALVEPCVPNLVEYNVAVRRNRDGMVVTSAIERPDTTSETLDFANKYLSGGQPGSGKVKMAPSEGMASLNRTVNPETLSNAQAQQIRGDAAALFDMMDLGGSVRIDFLSDSQTGDIWLNEVNPIPGSFAYFLWEAAEPRLSFLDLTSAMIDEGLRRHRAGIRVTDARSSGGQIFTGDA